MTEKENDLLRLIYTEMQSINNRITNIELNNLSEHNKLGLRIQSIENKLKIPSILAMLLTNSLGTVATTLAIIQYIK